MSIFTLKKSFIKTKFQFFFLISKHQFLSLKVYPFCIPKYYFCVQNVHFYTNPKRPFWFQRVNFFFYLKCHFFRPKVFLLPKKVHFVFQNIHFFLKVYFDAKVILYPKFTIYYININKKNILGILNNVANIRHKIYKQNIWKVYTWLINIWIFLTKILITKSKPYKSNTNRIFLR